MDDHARHDPAWRINAVIKCSAPSIAYRHLECALQASVNPTFTAETAFWGAVTVSASIDARDSSRRRYLGGLM